MKGTKRELPLTCACKKCLSRAGISKKRRRDYRRDRVVDLSTGPGRLWEGGREEPAYEMGWR